MKFTHIRHGSHIVKFKGRRFLVDPVFADVGTMSAMPKARSRAKNPMLPLPFGIDAIGRLDAVIITHTHFDHFDEKAIELLPKQLPIICRSHDYKKIRRAGFMNIETVDTDKCLFGNILVRTVGGRHGKGLAGILMGKTTGFVLTDASLKPCEPKTYIIGDSIWCAEVEQTIEEENPEVIIAFAGAAKLPFGNNITMGKEDIHQLALASGNANIIAIHMDTWSHCFLTKKELKAYIKGKTYDNRILIPDEGTHLSF